VSSQCGRMNSVTIRRGDVGVHLEICMFSFPNYKRYYSNVFQENEQILGVDLELVLVSFLLGLPSRHVTSVGKRRL
jgi:hypothetical protein